MPIQTRDLPTFDSVVRQIKAFEDLYKISTDVYLTHDSRSAHVDEDDGMQWSFLYEQRCVLRDAAIPCFYSGSARQAKRTKLENVEVPPELLAA